MEYNTMHQGVKSHQFNKSLYYSISIIIGCVTALSLICLIAIPNFHPGTKTVSTPNENAERPTMLHLDRITDTMHNSGTLQPMSTDGDLHLIQREHKSISANQLDKAKTRERSHIEQPETIARSATRIKATKEGAARRLPGAIIIGVKKCGTRALLEYLRVHPLVKAPGPEIHFFDKYYHRGLEWYRKQMPITQPNQLTIEKTPNYFVRPEVPARIKAMAPNVKLLVVVRNPVTRAMSDYAQQAANHPGRLRGFDHVVLPNGPNGTINDHWGGVKFGLYARLFQPWLKQFRGYNNSLHWNGVPSHQIHFVSGEALISDPAAEMHLVEQFLGLPRYISRAHFYFNESRGFPCVWKPKRLRSTPANRPQFEREATQINSRGSINDRTTVSLPSIYNNAQSSKVDGIDHGTQPDTISTSRPPKNFDGAQKLTISLNAIDSSKNADIPFSVPAASMKLTANAAGSYYYKCLGRTKGRPHPNVAPITLSRLKMFFKPHNRRLFALLGRNFGWNDF